MNQIQIHYSTSSISMFSSNENLKKSLGPVPGLSLIKFFNYSDSGLRSIKKNLLDKA